MSSTAQTEQYIRQAARKRGIDPDIAVRVARSEGLAPGVWQSNINHPQRGREPSYGPYQLLVGGQNGWPTGLGNEFVRQTGLDPKDPSTVNAQIDFALDNAAKNGWGAWYGAKKAGIGNRDGLGGSQSAGPAVFGSIMPGQPEAAAERPNIFAGMTREEAEGINRLAGGESKKNGWGRIANALKEVEIMPAARISGGGGDARSTGAALMQLLANPSVAPTLMARRMGRG